MDTYERAIDVLEVELRGVEGGVPELTPDQWRTPTLLRPWTRPALDPVRAGRALRHLHRADPDADRQPDRTARRRDRVSFFIFPRSEVAPVVYDYAYTMVGARPGGDARRPPRDVRQDVEESRATAPTRSVPATTH